MCRKGYSIGTCCALHLRVFGIESHCLFPVQDELGVPGASNLASLTVRDTDDDLPYCWPSLVTVGPRQRSTQATLTPTNIMVSSQLATYCWEI